MIISCLYSITLPDGRVYIGRSRDPGGRFSDHCVGSLYVDEAMRLCGPEKCELKILCRGEETYISELEDLAIDRFRTFYPFGCNRTGGRTGYSIKPREYHGLLKPAVPSFGLSESNDARLVVESAALLTPLDVIIDTAASPQKSPDSGWIEISVNTQGRRAVERVFPGWAFNWRRVQWPRKGWWSALLHLPSLANNRPHFIRFKLGRVNGLSEFDDAELACLLARAASDQGARAAWLTYFANCQPFLQFPKNNFQWRAPTSLIKSGKGLVQDLASF